MQISPGESVLCGQRNKKKTKPSLGTGREENYEKAVLCCCAGTARQCKKGDCIVIKKAPF